MEESREAPGTAAVEELPCYDELLERPRLTADMPVGNLMVDFSGLKRVSSHSLIVECLGLRNVRDLADVEQAIHMSCLRMEELKLLKTVRAEAEVRPGGPPLTVDCTFVVEEKKRATNVSAFADRAGEVSCEVRVEQPALLGGPLSGAVQAKTTMSQTQEFLLHLETPRFLGTRLLWSLDLTKGTRDEVYSSSYCESQIQALTRISDLAGLHSVTCEAALRDLQPTPVPNRFQSFEVQRGRLRSIKTSLQYNLAKLWPWGGFRTGCELAMPPGDVRFFRCDAQAGLELPLPFGLHWTVSGAIGKLLPLDSRPVCFQDRFFLGGASGSTSIFKGFADRGIGPMGFCELTSAGKRAKRKGQEQREVDSLGGTSLVNGFTALSLPLPLPESANFQARAFGFLNAGWLRDSTRGPWLSGFGASMRTSAGVGLSFPLGAMGSLELTYARPLCSSATDVLQPLQLGLRIASSS